jgi:hypothetical protein
MNQIGSTMGGQMGGYGNVFFFFILLNIN